MGTRILGIDLAVTAAHKAIVLDVTSNRFVSSVLSFSTDPTEIDRVLTIARAGAVEPVRLVTVLEATGTAWFSVGTYLDRQGVEVYRVNGQQVGELRRIYQRRAKSDRIDARVLAKLYLLCPERLHRLSFPTGLHLALQQAVREVIRATRSMTVSKQRLLAFDQLGWLGQPDGLAPYDEAARWWREHWYNPWRVCEAGEATLTQAWQAASPVQPAETNWLSLLMARARQVTTLYGAPAHLDYDRLQASVTREQARLGEAESLAHDLRLQVVRPLYRQLSPDRHLESLRGVGQDSAAVYIAFIYDILRFPSLREFRGWHGLVPFSRQSGESQARGLHITQAGPDPIKLTAFLNANVARLYDPEIAALYYDQMMNRGKHHLQAVCACATRLLDRVYVVLRDQRPFELRDVDGSPVTKAQARRICQERYQVPDQVRQRNNHRVRQERQERKTEQRYRRQHPRE